MARRSTKRTAAKSVPPIELLEDEADAAAADMAGDPNEEAFSVSLGRSGPVEEVGEGGAKIIRFGKEIIVDLDGNSPAGAFSQEQENAPVDHNENLALHVPEDVLSQIAEDVIEWVQTDEASRRPWYDRLRKGLELLGVTDTRDAENELFPGSSQATYPLIAQACVQFQARAIDEIFPPAGPVKANPVGEKTPELLAQAERVENHMNYQLTVEDRGYFRDTDQMLMNLPLAGSMFRKVFRNHIMDINQARTIRPEDFIAPYTATSLEDAPRYTHRIPMQRNDMRKLQVSGFYRDIPLVEPTQESPDRPDEGAKVRDEADDRERVIDDKSFRHTVYECHCDYDIPGFEDRDESGKPTGIALPYIITVDFDTRAVLSIRRNWRERDPLKRKRIWFNHYQFLPSTGFYGWGYIHLIGGLADATTGALRALLDGAAFANMQGGFKSKDAKLPKGEVTIRPGVWVDTDMTADELAKAFYTPPFKEPSQALFHLLGLLVDGARSFASTTENMVGEANNNGPVGTTVALIEQGSKVYSGIHKRIHKTAGEEFQLLAELNYEYLPPEGYPFTVRGVPRSIAKADYDGRVDVIPVSDPNIFSSTQRIAIAQATLDLAARAPHLYDEREAHMRMLVALRAPDPDALLPKPADPVPMDPVSENMAMLVGQPVRAFPEQDHQAHLDVLLAFLQHPGFGANKQVQEQVLPAFMAHAAEHLAYLYGQQMAMAAGIPFRPVNLRPGKDEPFTEPLPPQIDNGIAMLAAKASEQFKQMAIGLPAEQQQDPAMAEAQAKIARENAAFEAEEKRKAIAFDNEQRRLDLKLRAEIERNDAKQEAQLDAEAIARMEQRSLDRQDHDIEMQREAEAHALEQAAAAESAEGENSSTGALEEMNREQFEILQQQGAEQTALLRSIAESLQMNSAAIMEMARVMSAPKRPVFGPDGRISHVEPILGGSGPVGEPQPIIWPGGSNP